MSALLHIFHLTIPHRSNNFRARLLQPLGLLTLLLAYMLSQYFVYSYSEINPGVLGYAANIPATEVIRLTNQKRTASGLAELQTNSVLSQAAEAKGKHMLEHDYWAHVAPDGTEPWAFFVNYGYKYRYAGENLARDFSNPQAAVDAWMASPSHRDNLMSPKYTEIGIAVVEGDLNGVDTTLIVQLFGTPMAVAAPIVEDESVTVTPVAAAETEDATVPAIQEEKTEVMKLDITNEANVTSAEPLVSPMQIGRISASILIVILLVLLLVDIIILGLKKVPRNSGRPLAHISFFALIFTIILLAKAGSII
jgi:hypothetical protein